jgi:hypothetical protein
VTKRTCPNFKQFVSNKNVKITEPVNGGFVFGKFFSAFFQQLYSIVLD